MPECAKAWSDEFLVESLTKTWLDSAYKEHRQKILLDQEKARLPETQEEAAVYMNAKTLLEEIQPRINALEAQIKELPIHKQLDDLFKDCTDTTQTSAFRNAAFKHLTELRDSGSATKEAKPLRKQIKALKSDAFITAKDMVEWFGRALPYDADDDEPVQKKTWTFVGKCPKTDCMGFVGLDYTCGLCKVKVCKDCMEPKETEHACNSDNVLNVKALRKEAKPCPKCAAMISKIDGCDQMWCTQCHTAFSWRTGVEETTIHNPHFYEWMRRTGQQMPVGPVQMGGAAPCGFRGIQNAFANSIRTAYPPTFHMKEMKTVDNLNAISHGSGHIELCLRTLNDKIGTEQRRDEEDKRILRVRRLAKEITDAEWMKPLERMERSSKRRHALRDVYDMYIQATMTIMEQFNTAVANIERTKWERRSMSVDDRVQFELDAANTAADAAIKQYTELSTYVNEELRKIKSRFTTAVQFIPTLY